MILTREQAIEIFKRRVSTRSYDPARTISDEDFNTILEFGRLSPQLGWFRAVEIPGDTE